jgi:hypothetical protein
MPPISMETGLKRKQILILGFKSPDLWEKNFYFWFKLPSQCYFVMDP